MSLLSQVTGIIFLRYKSSRPSSIRPLTACLYKPFKRYSQDRRQHDEPHKIVERAPSTAEEFKRVAEEKQHEIEERAASTAEKFKRVEEEKQKLKAAEQGIANQTSDKYYDAAEEAVVGQSSLDSVENRFKEREGGADYRGKG